MVGSQSWDDETPQFIPTRDVDIVYAVTPGQSTVLQRVRWLASEHLQCIDGPEKSSTIIDDNAKQIILLNSSSRTYNQMSGGSVWPIATPQERWGAARRFHRGGLTLHRLVMDRPRGGAPGFVDGRRRTPQPCY